MDILGGGTRRDLSEDDGTIVEGVKTSSFTGTEIEDSTQKLK